MHSNESSQVVHVHQGTHLVFVKNIQKTNLYCFHLLKVFCIRVVGNHLVNCLSTCANFAATSFKFVICLDQLTIVSLMPLDDFNQTQLGVFLCTCVDTINVDLIDAFILRAQAYIVQFTIQEDLSHHRGLLYPLLVMLGSAFGLFKVLYVAAKDRIHF